MDLDQVQGVHLWAVPVVQDLAQAEVLWEEAEAQVRVPVEVVDPVRAQAARRWEVQGALVPALVVLPWEARVVVALALGVLLWEVLAEALEALVVVTRVHLKIS